MEKTGFTVVLDPGHGGDEPGATAPNGTPEKDLNLKIALEVIEALKQRPGIRVVLTRNSDESVSLEERIRRATAAKGDLLLSLHHNALPDGRDPLTESGVATFYYHPFALPAAQHFQQNLVAGTGFSDYGILYDSLYMCRVMAMPSLLLELGFLTNPDDAERCLDSAAQKQTASVIARAIEGFCS
jgi:N-acetylmuramoyl-L-alanine amidase